MDFYYQWQNEMQVQLIIVALMVLAAGWYLVKSILKSAKGHSCESGSCGCDKPKPKIQN